MAVLLVIFMQHEIPKFYFVVLLFRILLHAEVIYEFWILVKFLRAINFTITLSDELLSEQ